MEKKSRRKFSPEFKTKVVLEALKERDSLEEIARKYEIHPNQIGTWKKEFLARAALVFSSDEKTSEDKKQQEALDAWLKELKAAAKIEINKQLIAD